MRRTLRIGTVSYLNARPLIYGLDRHDDIALTPLVPSALLPGLQAGTLDVALLPVIDYQRMDGLRIVPSGGIGCDGPTLTVRIFSRVPIASMTALCCDPDSHTSVALARIVLAEQFAIEPPFLPALASDDPGHARLLIGDKVVCAEPAGFGYQLDLGGAWKEMTELPFVFATWIARPGVDLGDLPARLAAALADGRAHVDDIVRLHAVPNGWPAELARQYLTRNLQFDIGPAQLQAIARFHELAARYRLIDGVRPLEVVGR